ncbi:unnamed protein product [Diplocarpon coronariae]
MFVPSNHEASVSPRRTTCNNHAAFQFPRNIGCISTLFDHYVVFSFVVVDKDKMSHNDSAKKNVSFQLNPRYATNLHLLSRTRYGYLSTRPALD